MTQLDIIVFAFNRGQWLSNLLSSIKTLVSPEVDRRVLIFDDHSTDPHTLDVLNAAARDGIEIFQATSFDLQGRGSRGGLHAGIESALTKVARPAALALLLQDDMQIVRPVDAKEIGDLQALAKASRNPFVYVNFWTGGVDYRRQSMKWENGYFVKFSRREGRYRFYTDVCLVDVGMLRASGFEFHRSEKAMDHEAARKFGPMAWSAFPFTAMLPDPVVYRDKQALGGTIYRFRPMQPEEIRLFLTRSVQDHHPAAEEFLSLEGTQLPAPWKYGVELTRMQKLARFFRRLPVPGR